jgi:DNA-directed RNA polymerase sigma subunit (sigma70/sigma32)
VNEDDPKKTDKKSPATPEEVWAALTPQERGQLRERFGIDLSSDATLEEVGRQFEVTRRRIRELEERARKARGLPEPPDDEQ